MAGRPCKPGSDLHGLWRLILPGTAFPACGVADDADAEVREPVSATDQRGDKARAETHEPRPTPRGPL